MVAVMIEVYVGIVYESGSADGEVEGSGVVTVR